MKFRGAEKKDIKALLEIEDVSFERAVYGDDLRESAADFKAYMRDADYRLIVAENDAQRIDGYVLVDVARYDPSAANIDSLAVRKEARQLGVVAGLLRAAFAVSKEQGFPKLTFEMNENNPAIQALFNNKAVQRWTGFTPCGRENGYYCDGGAAIYFQCPLDQAQP